MMISGSVFQGLDSGYHMPVGNISEERVETSIEFVVFVPLIVYMWDLQRVRSVLQLTSWMDTLLQ